MKDSKVDSADTTDANGLLGILAKVKAGDFTARMPLEWTGVADKVADGFNEVMCATMETDSAEGNLVGAGSQLEEVEAELELVRAALASPTRT